MKTEKAMDDANAAAADDDANASGKTGSSAETRESSRRRTGGERGRGRDVESNGKGGIQWSALFAGGVAGFAVDVALYPLDTIKTRMQSSEGFLKAGGFKKIYNGLGPAALGSFPGAALFFFTYETTKPLFQDWLGANYNLSYSPALSHMAAGAIGEVAACLARVPTENVKQNLQTARYATPIKAIRGIFASRGISGFMTGYVTTVAREVPFSIIQFPLWEGSKVALADFTQRAKVSPIESAACGSVAGAFAAAVTTPLDVAKTRLMTSPDMYSGMIPTMVKIHKNEGLFALFRGVEARVMWIAIGGFVFFGAFEESRRILDATVFKV